MRPNPIQLCICPRFHAKLVLVNLKPSSSYDFNPGANDLYSSDKFH